MTDYLRGALAFVAELGAVYVDRLPPETVAALGAFVEPGKVDGSLVVSAAGAREALSWRESAAALDVEVGRWLSDSWRAGAITVSKDGRRVGVRNPANLAAVGEASVVRWRHARGRLAARAAT